MRDVLLSFCIASYRRSDLVIEQIEELLRNSSNRFEIIVCDDCSNDGTIDRIRKIQDPRVKVYSNKENVGGMLNIYDSLMLGSGDYVFYLNDRDQMDFLKLNVLISILDNFDRENVGFARTCSNYGVEKYIIYESGEKAFLEFACRINHPTGYIFKKSALEDIQNGRNYFGDEYGDYGFTILCAILSLKYNGAYIRGNMCDIERLRIDFNNERSRFNRKRKDKSMWYSVEAQERELRVVCKVCQELHIEQDWIEKLFLLRYEEYLNRVTVQYGNIMCDPVNTLHYGVKPITNKKELLFLEVKNCFRLKHKAKKICNKFGMKPINMQIDNITKKILYDLL